MTRLPAAAFTTLLFLTTAVVTAGGCSKPPKPAAQTKVVLTPGLGGPWSQIGQALTVAYTHRLTNVVADATKSAGLEQTADAIEDGRADLAIEDAETAYIAYSKGTTESGRPHKNIRAISVLFSTAVQIVVRGDAGIATVADLRGRRVDVGQHGSPVERAARLILKSHGLSYDAITPVFGARGGAGAMRARELDVRFFYTPYPQAGVEDVTRSADARLIPIERESLAAIQAGHHFLKSVVIPVGTYPNQHEQILTVGMDVLLLCRADLPERLVHDMTAALFDSIPELSAAHRAAAAIDPDRGATTAVPLHPGAVRYYREREILK